MPQESHLQDVLVNARIVPARAAKGCVELNELAAASAWSPAPLEMVGFSLPDGVRQAGQTTLPQLRGRFHDVRLVAGMAGIGDVTNAEYVCDSVHDNLGRVNNAWYEKYGLLFDDAGNCKFYCGKNEPLRVANAISFFGWENRNYAHWLSEKLGRFYWIAQADLPADTVLLVEAGLPASIMDSLAIFWPRERTLCVQQWQACDVDVLHHFSDTADIWEPREGYVYQGDEYHLYPTAISWMADHVKQHCNAEEGHGRAYLIRPPGGNGRAIVNQQELVVQLGAQGFRAFQPELLDLASQVRALAACELAMLGSGAAAANLLWMPRQATMVVLIQDNPQMWYWFFHALAAAVGVRLVYYPVRGLPGTHGVIFHRDVEVPVEPLLQWLVRDSERIAQGNLANVQDGLAHDAHGNVPPATALERLGAGLARLRREKAALRATPLVSVCIAAYNHEAYIGEALESVLAQSYSNIEILVVDDASADGSAAVIEGYAKRYPDRICALVLSENEGPSRAANRLFAMARGAFVALLGSDDRMLPQRIERQVDHLLGNPECVGVFTDIAVIDAQGQRPAEAAGGEGLFNQPITHLRRQLLTGNFLNAPSAMVRRSDLLAAGGYDPLLRYVQDYDLWGRLLLRGELARLPECLTEYRVHGANLSIFGQDGPNFAARCETVETIVRFVRSWPLETILPGVPGSDEERARGLLELAGVLELVDRNFFGKPSLGCAHAYQLTLEAGQLLPHLALSAKRHLERSLDEGFHPQWRPFAWFDGAVPAWFAEHGRYLGAPSGSSELTRWLEARVPTAEQSRLIEGYLQANAGGPMIAVVILDLDGDTKALAQTIRSLSIEQGWYASVRMLTLSTEPVPVTRRGDKLHMLQVDADSHVETLNAELRQMDFNWVMLVRAGETFTPSGLLMTVLELIGAPDCRAVYADELHRLPGGQMGAAFRPGFNLDMLLSFPAGMARHWLFQREVLLEAGAFDARYPGALEFDLLLRLIEEQGMQGLGHIDEPLLVAHAPLLQDNADEQAALQRHLAVRGYANARLLPHLPGRYRIDYGHGLQPLVSIIVPTKDQLPILQRCVESLLEKTRYPNYELLIVDNDSQTAEAQAWLNSVEGWGEDKVRVLRYPHPFNYSAINNMAASAARGEYLVLLNNDTAILRDDWLDAMLNHALRPEVGVVGAKLLYPDGRIQHAGVLLGLRGPANHPFTDEAMDAPGYMQRLQIDQNYSAVTAACLMIRKSLYEEVGGLDEENFRVSYNDVDLCLKTRQAGYLTVWTPHAVVMHEGSVSQKKVDVAVFEAKRKRFLAEQDAMYEKWLPLLAADPAYNRNLSRSGNGFELEGDTALTWRPLTWRPLPVVLAHPADPWGCGNYRVIKPFEALRDAGMVDGMLSPGLLQVIDLERFDPDVIILQRQLGDERLDAMRRLKAFSRAFKVYELDDYLPNLPLKNLHREQMPKDLLKSLRKGLSFVDRFVVSTQPLAEAFAGLHEDIRVVENRLPLDWWQNLQGQRRRGRKPRVGWAGGVSHTGDLELIVDVVRELADEVEWVFMGMCPEQIRPYVHEAHGGVDIEAYPAALAALDLDLALAPVEQNLFNECKSNLRLLEYGACGFPVICSDIRCYQGDLPVTRVKNRFKDWVEAIRMHLADLDATARQGDELRNRVLADWMLEGANLEAWKSAWSER